MSDPLSPTSEALPIPSSYDSAPPPSAPPLAPYVQQDEYDAQPPLTPIQRVADTFLAPSKTFADIRRNRSWWLPFVIIAICAYLFSATAYKRVGMTGLVDSALRSDPARYEKFKEQPPAQQATGRSVTSVILQTTLLGWPLYQLLFTAIFALLLWVGFNFILGGSATYGAMFAVYMFASLPGILRALLSVVMLFVGDAETFSINDPVGTNPGYYLSPDSAAWLKSFLGSFDLITLWVLFLSALGGAIVSRVKPAKGYALVFGVWFLFVLIKVGFAAATS